MHNERMIIFIDFLVNAGYEKNETALLKKIGYEFTSNMHLIRKGERGFRMEHVTNLCETYNGDANFILVRNYKEMFRTSKKQPAIIKLREAVMLVDMELKGK